MPEKYKRKKLGGTTINNLRNSSRISSTSPRSSTSSRSSRSSTSSRSSRSSTSPRSSRSSTSSRSSRSPLRPTPSSRSPTSPTSPRSMSSPPHLIRQNAVNFTSISPRTRPPSRLSRQYNENLYILHNNERDNVRQNANNFLSNLMLENQYLISSIQTLPNEITYGFRMFNNLPARIVMNRNSGALRNDYTFFRRI